MSEEGGYVHRQRDLAIADPGGIARPREPEYVWVPYNDEFFEHLRNVAGEFTHAEAEALADKHRREVAVRMGIADE